MICFYFSKPIYAFLTQPLARALIGHPNHHLIYTAVYETFFTYVKVGMFAGLCLSFPIVASQIWMFVAPGLYKHERNAFLPFLIASPVLFLIGAGFVFYVMLPFALKFFLGFETPGTANTLGIEMLAKVSDYLELRHHADFRIRADLPDAGGAGFAGGAWASCRPRCCARRAVTRS